MDLDWPASIDADSRRLVELVVADPAARVPACPDWSAADLLEHLTQVQEFWAATTRLGGAVPADRAAPAPADGAAARALAATASLLEAFRTSGPDGRTWVWWLDDGGTVPVADSMRRQAHEALVHRVDAEQAAGVPSRIDTALALDGVLEWLQIMAARVRGPEPSRPQRLLLYANDTADRWLVEVGDAAPRLVAGDEADAMIAGPAAELYLLLWRRRPLDGLFVEGDRDLVTAFLAGADLT